MPRLLKYTITAFAGAVFASGAIPLIGYITHQPRLYMPIPDTQEMAPNTALSFCIVGLTLCLLAQQPSKND